MKPTLITVALFGALAVSTSSYAQRSVTLYGLIDTGLVYTNNQQGHSNWQENSSSTQNTVFGLKGDEDLGGGGPHLVDAAVHVLVGHHGPGTLRIRLR